MPMTAGTGRHLWAPKPTGDKVTSEDSECRTLLALKTVTQEAAGAKGYMPVPLAATRAASAMRRWLVHIDLRLDKKECWPITR